MNRASMPQSIGRYRILTELGHGAMGVVYGAEDPLLSRKVAIKTILMAMDAEERAEYEPRFYQEARAAGSLNHPNIITIYDIGREGDLAYMAMELLEGVELRSLLMNGQLNLSRALHIAAQVAEGVAYAHERGVIHRDLKPGNVMVLRGDFAKIMDFGIARMRTSDVKTATGMLLGSPKYMSPEQIVGRQLDHRSDIFSLGTLFYEMITGAAPFAGPDLPALMHAITQAQPMPPSRADRSLPPIIDLILAKALAKKVDDRYQDAHELAADLRACRDRLPPALREAARPGMSDLSRTGTGTDAFSQSATRAALDAAARNLAQQQTVIITRTGNTTGNTAGGAPPGDAGSRVTPLADDVGSRVTPPGDADVRTTPLHAQPFAPASEVEPHASTQPPGASRTWPLIPPEDDSPALRAGTVPLPRTSPQPLAQSATQAASHSNGHADAHANGRADPLADTFNTTIPTGFTSSLGAIEATRTRAPLASATQTHTAEQLAVASAPTLITPQGSTYSRDPSDTSRFFISSRFDAGATLMKLRAAQPAAGAQEDEGFTRSFSSTTRRLRKDPELRFVATAIGLALVGAVLIAVL